MRWILALLCCSCLPAETLDALFTRLPSWDRATIVAEDGQYLGELSPNPVDPNSVFCTVGLYGSTVSPTSVRCAVSQYGSPVGIYSPNCMTTITPPRLLVDGVVVAYITNNTAFPHRPALTLDQVLSLPALYPKP